MGGGPIPPHPPSQPSPPASLGAARSSGSSNSSGSPSSPIAPRCPMEEVVMGPPPREGRGGIGKNGAEGHEVREWCGAGWGWGLRGGCGGF